MKTIEDWKNHPLNRGEDVIKLIDWFCVYWERHNHLSISPAYTFWAHSVLGDYNLSDVDIQWSLKEEQVKRWFEEEYKDHSTSHRPGEKQTLAEMGMDKTSDKHWERWAYDELVEIKNAIFAFLN